MASMIQALVALFKFLLELFRWKKRNAKPVVEDSAIKKAIYSQVSIQKHIRELRINTKASRVIIAMVTNGGKIPDARAPLYGYLRYEDCADDALPVLDTWDMQRLDGSYKRMLRDFLFADNPTNYQITEKTLEPGMLKDMYIRHNIDNTYLSILNSQLDTEFWYLAIQFNEPKVLTPFEREEIRSQIHAIRSILWPSTLIDV